MLSLFSTPFFGWLSDYVGRRRMYVLGAVGTAVFVFPYFALLNSAVPALVVLGVDGLPDGRRPRPEGERRMPSEPPSTGPEILPAQR